MSRPFSASALIIVSLLVCCGALYAQPYLDPDLPVDARVTDLLSRMSLQEKVGQMTQADHLAIGNPQDVGNYFLGSILSGGASDPAAGNGALHWADLYDSLQSEALQTPLQIPLIYGIDAVHGHSNVTGATIFPHNIGLGATHNAELVEQAGRITAIEMAATGIDWTFAPCVAVPRDERWGRTYEGFSEDPELAATLGGAATRGLQGDSMNAPTSVAACAKHFIGDGGTSGGIDQGNTVLPEEELRAIHLPAYIEAIENDVKTIMASYNSWNGVKLHGHHYLLTQVLKEELGFEGFVVSDWAGIDQLPGGYSSDVETSIQAGIDMVMVPGDYVGFFNTLFSLVQTETLNQERIDDAVSRILRVKFELGLFENPMADRSWLPHVGSEAHRAVARQCVVESQTLLRLNDSVLPLPTQGVKVLVAGEHADNMGLQCGGWTIEWGGGSGDITAGTTLLEGLQEVAPDIVFVYHEDGAFSADDLEDADIIIAAIGEQPYAEFMGDSQDLTVNHDQIRMIRQLKRQGLPLITLLFSGRPMIIQHVLHNSDAFIASWLPGTEADGIAELLFGQYLPSGTLPMSWPRSMDQIPINVGDTPYDPLFPFGFGITHFDNSAQGSSPLLHSAMLIEGGERIELSFNKAMDHGDHISADFLVTRNQSVEVAVSGFGLSPLGDHILLLELDGASSEVDELAISYLSGTLQSSDGGSVESFQAEDVINLLPYVTPVQVIPGRIEAEDYIAMSGVQLENTSDVGGGENVGWIDNGDWMEYECHIEHAGSYEVTFRTACLDSPGQIRFLHDDEELFQINVPVTGDWQNWSSISEQSDLPAGNCSIRILASTGGFNLNWIDFDLLNNLDEEHTPLAFSLRQNYPNPFNPQTAIQFDLPADMLVSLRIYDIAGHLVAVLCDNEPARAGRNEHVWQGRNQEGLAMPSGTYFCQLSVGSSSKTMKMMLLK